MKTDYLAHFVKIFHTIQRFDNGTSSFVFLLTNE